MSLKTKVNYHKKKLKPSLGFFMEKLTNLAVFNAIRRLAAFRKFFEPKSRTVKITDLKI